MKPCSFCGKLIRLPFCGALAEKDRDTMPADTVEQLGNGLVAQVGEVRAIEGRVSWQGLGQIEAERDLALEPRLDRVSISGNDLRRNVIGKSGNVLVEDFGNQRSVFGRGNLGPLRGALKEHHAH